MLSSILTFLKVLLSQSQTNSQVLIPSELELVNPETLKHEGFGASHKTFQLIPQVNINEQISLLDHKN